jgi:hypothetical protein
MSFYCFNVIVARLVGLLYSSEADKHEQYLKMYSWIEVHHFHEPKEDTVLQHQKFLENVTAASVIITSDHKHVNFKKFKCFNLNIFNLVP